jgi:hypothetical protein
MFSDSFLIKEVQFYESYDFKPLKSMSGCDPQNDLTCYPNVVDFYKKYCGDCLKKVQWSRPSRFFCMIQN